MPKESTVAKNRNIGTETKDPVVRSASQLFGYKLEASDGAIGSCQDLLFDDRHWAVRFVLVDTRRWLPGKRVVVSPVFFDEPRWEDRSIPVNLTRKEIEDCPEADEHAPVSRQYEIQYFGYYGLAGYWWGGDAWGSHRVPYRLRDERKSVEEEFPQEQGDPHLRSIKEILKYRVEATETEIGLVEDFLVEFPSYSIRYVVVDARGLETPRKILVSPKWIDSIRYANSVVRLEISPSEASESPEFDPANALTREYEAELFEYYGRSK